MVKAIKEDKFQGFVHDHYEILREEILKRNLNNLPPLPLPPEEERLPIAMAYLAKVDRQHPQGPLLTTDPEKDASPKVSGMGLFGRSKVDAVKDASKKRRNTTASRYAWPKKIDFRWSLNALSMVDIVGLLIELEL